MAVARPDAALPWFALRVRSRAEKTVSETLRSRGFETLCPTFLDRRRYSDRVKTVECALFPGYLFCRLNPDDRLPVLSSPGVESIVGFGAQPHPVDLREIEALSAVIQSGVLARPYPFLKVGQRVRVESGPLCQLEGILVATKSEYRLVLSVTLLQRSIIAELDSAQVRPV
ncbi:MAG TPA: transcription termination/antitermination NusG family protein [Bryobacteraceae bacterium]|jgi:transcription antitermination factor NusG|nr:transcription termination/antitermination NusG family protein [Bryobacteraceae bacterium]